MPRLTWEGLGHGAVVHAVIGGRQSAENSKCPGANLPLGGQWQLSGGKRRTERAEEGVSEPQVQRQKRLMLQRTWSDSGILRMQLSWVEF